MKSEYTQLKEQPIYKILFESIEEGLIVVDKTGRITMSNPRSWELFGYTQEELEQLKVEDLIPMNRRQGHPKLRDDFNHAPKKRPMGEGMNLQGLKKDGGLFTVEISLNHFTLANEIYVAALITDITKRSEQEKEILQLNHSLEQKVEERTQQLRESEQLYSAIARNFPNGTINVFDRNLNYIFVEGRELFQMGITSERLIGTSYLARLAEDIRPKIEFILRDVFKGASQEFEIEFKNQIYRINAVPLSKNNNTIDKILVVEKNITAEKIVSQNLEESLEKEKSLNEMKSRFVSMASHEFRTPLSTVLSSVSLIEKYIDNGSYENTYKHVKRIKNSVKGLTDILNDFLSVDKLESQKSEIKLSQFDYVKFANEMLEDMNSMCQDGQKIDMQIEATKSIITCDLNILRNILYNLLSNAIKYSKERQTIVYHTKITETHILIKIKDQGIGIPKIEQEQLFTRFFRAKNATNIKGTGLGLTIVKNYLDILGGSISFKSEENIGSEFNLIIPLKNN